VGIPFEKTPFGELYYVARQYLRVCKKVKSFLKGDPYLRYLLTPKKNEAKDFLAETTPNFRTSWKSYGGDALHRGTGGAKW